MFSFLLAPHELLEDEAEENDVYGVSKGVSNGCLPSCCATAESARSGFRSLGPASTGVAGVDLF